ncbi:MAG: 16S rRNA (guanine(966)-N(2))-methyltransferase RsmD [Sphingomonas sp.]|uniref:16S rRNA (guanine(966)-N(2))-methyltransferase RsmD n=1 Tax=Sphingomonas sp. TaxID=28214 RepID=UPI0018233B66|nr:16S rRNA (guanine(966)-N(2))-methyltransferase RsmD [Sphingomonas sp.]MBA3666434.1 16S rRNA (guanine(966)-N(2))-methyltransferase RsmD [Sphingomonas sp.]
MRVIAGAWRGRSLVAPQGQQTRPTADRTRETLFSMLVSRLGSFEGLRVADLYAGCGALGIEALSRGAAQAVLIENDRAALDAINANLASLGAGERATVRAASAAVLPREDPFDLILADPPYAEGSGDAVVRAIDAAQWAAPGAWMAIETASNQQIAPTSVWSIDAERTVGRARLTLLYRGA